MRFWTRAPEPGSLEEVIAIAVDAFQEFREFEYLCAGIYGQMFAAKPGADSVTAVQQMLDRLQTKFFGKKAQDPDGAQADPEKFLKMMETTFVRVHGDAIRDLAIQADRSREPATAQVYEAHPRGEFLE